MRSIYIRSLLFVLGLAMFATIELFAPRGIDSAAPAPPAGSSAARHAAA